MRSPCRQRASLRGQGRDGRYTAAGALPMFGRWQLTVRMDRPHAAPVVQRFWLRLDLPSGRRACEIGFLSSWEDSNGRGNGAAAAQRTSACGRATPLGPGAGNLAVLDALLAPPAGADDAGAPEWLRVRQGLAAFRAAVPDARWTIVEQIAAGDAVVTRLAVQGTFAGPLVGLAPPGRPATLTGVAISRFAEAHLVDLWLQADLLGLLQQLGVMPHLELDKAVAVAQMLRAGALLAAEPAPGLSHQAPSARGGTSTPPIPLAPTHAGTKGVTSMYARLVAFGLQAGKESVATDLARDLVPAIREQPGCEAVTCFGDSDSGQYYLYVLWSSEEEANAAARIMAPRLERHLAGNTVAPPQRNLYPVLESA